MTCRAAALLMIASVAAHASPACAACHDAIYQKQRVSHHAHTLRPFEGSRMAQALASARVTDESGYRFEYRDPMVSVSNGSGRTDAILEWAFGAGSLGFTAVGRFEGRYFEHRVSYFVPAARPGLTPGQSAAAPLSATAALGLFKTPEDAYSCFRCHSTGLERDRAGGPDLATLIPGLTCERCHGPGERHIAAARERASAQATRKAIFDAGHLPAKASVEVCGECHRTPAGRAPSSAPERDDPVSIRFQPVGLMASACFRRSPNLSCVTCHDPHTDAARNDATFYSGKCMACHAGSMAKVVDCKRGEAGNCLPCHMRRAALTPYLAFTDHRIRVY